MTVEVVARCGMIVCWLDAHTVGAPSTAMPLQSPIWVCYNQTGTFTRGTPKGAAET